MLNKATKFIKRNASPIMAGLGIMGFAVTVAMAVKNTFDVTIDAASTAIAHDFKTDDYSDEEKKKLVKNMVKKTTPVVLMGVASAMCIVCSSKISSRDKAAIVGAYGLLREAYGRKVPFDKHETPVTIISDDSVADDKKQLFFDEYSSQYFESTLVELISAQGEINHIFIHDGVIGLGTVQNMMGIPVVDPCNTVGWSLSAGEAFYNYDWIQFTNALTRMDDGLECWIVSMDVPPTADYLDM